MIVRAIARYALLLALPILVGAALAEEPHGAVRQVFQAHDRALGAHDIDGLMALYADNEELVLLGTGPGERWLGREAIRNAYLQFMSDFDPGTTDNHCTWSSIGERGDTAWLAAMCRITDYLANVQREFALNISAVLVRDGDDWRLQTMHFSNLAGRED